MTLRKVDPKSALTEAVADRIIECLRESGMKLKWVGYYCGVSPTTLISWLEQGAKRDGMEPYRSFAIRWVRTEAELMHTKAQLWMLGDSGALSFLKERWPKVYGPKAEPDYEAFTTGSTNAEEMAQLEDIIRAPEEYSVEHLFEKWGWRRDDIPRLPDQ